jgi:hypothetical protein
VLRRAAQAAFEHLDVPVHVAAGRTASLAGWMGGPSSVHAVTVEHGDRGVLSVETRRAADEPVADRTLARQALEDALRDDEPWPDRSAAGLAVWLRTRDRRAREIAARAPAVTRSVPLDGAAREFLVVSAGGAWAAVRRDAEVIVLVSGRGVRPDEVALERLADPVGTLLSD